MKHNYLFFLLMSFYKCCVMCMELQPQTSWNILPKTVIMPIIAMSNTSDKQTLRLVNKQLSCLASKKNIDNLLQWPCVLSRNCHLNLMIEYAISNNNHKMILAIKSASLCDHHDAVEKISYFIAPDDSSTLNYLSLYKNNHHDDYLLKLLPTIIAVYRGDQNICENYKEFIVEPEKRSTLSVLQLAAYCNHLAPAELFLTQKKKDIVNFQTITDPAFDSTPLHIAVTYNHIDMIKLCLTLDKTTINAIIEDNLTPLCIAITKKHYEAAIILLNEGSNPNIQPTWIKEPGGILHFVVLEGKHEIISLLLKNDILLDTQNEHGDTALTTLVNLSNISTMENKINGKSTNDYCNFFNIAQSLLIAGANPNIFNNRGTSALIQALIYHNTAMATLLLEHGADPHIKNSKGKNAFSFGLSNEMKELLEKSKK